MNSAKKCTGRKMSVTYCTCPLLHKIDGSLLQRLNRLFRCSAPKKGRRDEERAFDVICGFLSRNANAFNSAIFSSNFCQCPRCSGSKRSQISEFLQILKNRKPYVNLFVFFVARNYVEEISENHIAGKQPMNVVT